MDIQDFHPQAVSPSDLTRIKEVELMYSKVATHIMSTFASSAHRTAALRKLLESKMTLVHAISHP